MEGDPPRVGGSEDMDNEATPMPGADSSPERLLVPEITARGTRNYRRFPRGEDGGVSGEGEESRGLEERENRFAEREQRSR